MQAKRLSAGLLLLGAALQSSALTIGRPNGNAWIGKPLDLVIPLELGSSESGESLCLEAEVLQGDARLDDKRVTLSLDPGPSPDAPRVRLRTTRAIEEPVVTVRFTAGCVTKSTRQYVLLADLPEAPPVVASPPRLAAPAASAAEATGPAPAARSSRPARAGGSAASRAPGESGDEASSPPPPPPPPPRKRVATVVPPPGGSVDTVRKPRAPSSRPAAAATSPSAEPKSRLQIEALAPEPSAQAPRPTLAPSNTAGAGAAPAAQGIASPGSTPSTPAAESPNAAAAAALAAAAEQGRRDAERLKELEAALATLREQSAQTQRQLLELRGSLAQAEASRYRNPVVYGLLALLALALIGLMLLWRSARRARQAAWWGVGPEEEAAAAVAAKPSLPRHGELADEDDDDDDEEEAAQAAPADVSGLRKAAQGLRVTALPAGVGASVFQQGQVRQVNAEEVFDVQQQSEFFVSLGQHEQAIGVLREHIAANPGTSALAYLDLLGVLQSLGRREDYAAVAREFGEGFNVEVPAFDHFSTGGRGLEHYRAALQRIADKWPSQGTADLIDELVFRKPGSGEESFDLPAYQDLLMLYAVARDLGEYEGQWALPTPVPVQPPVAVLPGQTEHAYQETSPMPYLAEPRPAERPLELDLADLDRTAFETLRAPIEPGPAADRPAPAPSVDPHVIDFDPFDPATNQGDLRPRHLGVKR